ncbi:LysE family translocator [Ferrovibrio xuzhouensis]|uniref:LysE family translocator n=1 Tax=Ferrovibrio xuzhouensis TaxID=1576914 RepID=A0ABV7VJ14_9PROT
MGTVDSLLMLVKGALAGFVIAAPVGPVGVLCIQRTLHEGRLSGLTSGLGAAFADAFYGCIAAFGLSLVSHWLESHELIFRLGGGLFLLFMASRMLRVALQPTPETIMPVLRHESLPGHFMSTFLLTATNPITIVAFLGIFAFFGIGAFGLSNAMAAWLVAGVFAGSSIWWLSLAGLAGAYRHRLGNGGLRWINGVSGVLILAFGLYGIGSVLWAWSGL